MSGSRRTSKRLRETYLTSLPEPGLAGSDGDSGESFRKKHRRSMRIEALRLLAPAGAAAVSTVEQQGAPHLWSLELCCRVLSYLGAADVARVALASSWWNAAVKLNLRVRTELSFSDGPRGVVPPGLSSSVLYSLLGRCPRLQRIYGLHFSSPLPRGTFWSGRHSKSSPSSSSAIDGGRAKEPLTVADIIRALRQCRQLKGIEISDLGLLESVTDVFFNVRILYGFRNRHGRLPLEAAVLGEPPKVRLCPDILTTSLELYAVTLPSLPRMLHVRRLRLQYVQFSQPLPFSTCALPHVESFVMKFCTVLPERDYNPFFVDMHAFQLDLPCYRPLLEALATAPNLSNLELVALPISGNSLQQLVMARRAGGGCFTKLRHVALGNCPNVVEDDLGVLIVSSRSNLERLSVQQSLSRDSLLRALAVCGCSLPSLEHLHLGYSEQPPADLELVEPRYRPRLPYDVDRFRTRSPCLLTDGGLTLVLASQLMPCLRSLTIADSPHLIDSRTWTAPIRTRLTDLTLTRCHSLRLSDLEDAVEQMTVLQSLTLEHVFREPPKGCWHVGLTAGTGLGASAGPFGMAVGRTSARTSARQPHSSSSSSSAATSTASPAGRSGNGSGTAVTSASVAATIGGRQCTCISERSLAPSQYRTSQVHAYTQVTHDVLRSSYGSSSSSSSARCSGSGGATASSSHGSGNESSGGAAAAAQPPVAAAAAASPSSPAGQRPSQQQAEAAALAAGSGGDSSACGLCPSCGRVRQAPLPLPPHRRSAAASRPCARCRRQRSRDGCGSRRSTSEGDDASRCPDCQQLGLATAASASPGRQAAAPTGAASSAAPSCRPRLACKATGTSDPLPQPHNENPFRLRSSTIVSLALEDVGISNLILECCPKLDAVTAFGCRTLRHISIVDNQQIGPLSRMTLSGCPRLDGASVAHWMLSLPVPRLLPAEGSATGLLRVCTVEANWKLVQSVGAKSFVEFVKYWLPCTQMTDRADIAYVVAEEAGPWTDARRRVQLESSLSRLLLASTKAAGGSHLTPTHALEVESERCDSQLSVNVQATTGNATGNSGEPANQPAASSRGQAALRLQRGQAEVTVTRPLGVTDEDELCRDGLMEGPLRVRYVHNISQPCSVCSRTIEPWSTPDCAARWRKLCECEKPSTSIPFRHITCVYFYATASDDDVDSL